MEIGIKIEAKLIIGIAAFLPQKLQAVFLKLITKFYAIIVRPTALDRSSGLHIQQKDK